LFLLSRCSFLCCWLLFLWLNFRLYFFFLCFILGRNFRGITLLVFENESFLLNLISTFFLMITAEYRNIIIIFRVFIFFHIRPWSYQLLISSASNMKSFLASRKITSKSPSFRSRAKLAYLFGCFKLTFNFNYRISKVNFRDPIHTLYMNPTINFDLHKRTFDHWAELAFKFLIVKFSWIFSLINNLNTSFTKPISFRNRVFNISPIATLMNSHKT